MGQQDPKFTPMEYNSNVDEFQETEYPMLKGKTYMDHGGTTLYAKSLIDKFAADMGTNLYGNPHSASAPANFSSRMVDETRDKTLRFFGADPEHFDLIFVANATAAIKLVMDGFKDLVTPDLATAPTEGGFWFGYHVDSHNSLIGIRECSGDHHLFRTDAEVDAWLSSPSHLNASGKLGLFAYPGQSNMTGRRLPLSWPGRLRASSNAAHNDTYTLLDAAALATTAPLHPVFSDPARAPDFTALSFYKVFGFPDLGGLIVRKASGRILASGRRYFGGGTVSLVTVHGANPYHFNRDISVLHETLEDGTLPFHSIVALNAAIATHERLYGPEPMTRISRHANFLGKRLYDGLSELRHPNGQQVCHIYGAATGKTVYGDARTQGATVSFNVKDASGQWIPYTSNVERAADKRGIYVRSGQLCNPGGVATYLELERWHMSRLWVYGHRCGQHEQSGTEIYYGKPTGVVRVSMGAMTTMANVDTFLAFLRDEYIMEDTLSTERPLLLDGSMAQPVKRLSILDEGMLQPVMRHMALDDNFLQPIKRPLTLEESISLVIRVNEEDESSLDGRFESSDSKSDIEHIDMDNLTATPELTDTQESSDTQESPSDQKSSDILPRSFTSSITQVNSASTAPDEKARKEEKEYKTTFYSLPSPTSEEKEQLAIRSIPRPPRPEEKKASTIVITSVQGFELMKHQIGSRASARAVDVRKKEEPHGLKKLLSHKIRPKRSMDVMGMI